MKNPQDMSPMEMRALMRQDRMASSTLEFRNKAGEIIFTAIYVEGPEQCKEVLAAVTTATKHWDTDDSQRTVGP